MVLKSSELKALYSIFFLVKVCLLHQTVLVFRKKSCGPDALWLLAAAIYDQRTFHEKNSKSIYRYIGFNATVSQNQCHKSMKTVAPCTRVNAFPREREK
jgi:hypothetical protein